MKTFRIFLGFLLAITFTQLLGGVFVDGDKDKLLQEFPHEILTYVSPDQNNQYYYTSNGDQVQLTVKQRSGEVWNQSLIEIPGLRGNHSHSVIGEVDSGNRLILLNCFDGTNKGASGLYFTEKSSEGWSKLLPLPVEGVSKKDAVYGAYVDPKGEVLFIALDDPRRSGKEDLFASFPKEDGTWSWPRNLGKEVNSAGSDFAPFLSLDRSKLYFSSDREGGFGKADVYEMNKLADWSSWSNPENLGEKFNTVDEETFYAELLNEDTYLVRGPINYDIFNFATLYFGGGSSVNEGVLVDNEPVIERPATDNEPSLSTTTTTIEQPKTDQVVEQKAPLKELEQAIVLEMPDYNAAEKKVIYFDLDSDALSTESKEILNQVSNFYATNPSAKLELVGHTCDLGSLEYNQNLSKRRARQALQYLVDKGLDYNKISYQAFGESVPIDESQANRSLNRRVELLFSESVFTKY